MIKNQPAQFISAQAVSSLKDGYIYIFNFLGKVAFVKGICDPGTLCACCLTPIRILQDRIQQFAELILSFVLIAVTAFHQHIVQTRIPSAK